MEHPILGDAEYPKFVQYQLEKKIPCICTVCKSKKLTLGQLYLLVVDINDYVITGLVFTSNGSFRCQNFYEIETFDLEWSWDKTVDEYNLTHNNSDYIQCNKNSKYELNLEIKGNE